MSRVKWGEAGSALYESGVDRGVLYVEGTGTGVPWNGLTAIEEKPSGGDNRSYYQDGFKYLNLQSRVDFEGTISAFFSPAEFDPCDGVGTLIDGIRPMYQRRKSFGLTWRTLIGNDLLGVEYGYMIHILYNALASPSDHAHETLGEAVDPVALNWDVTAKSVRLPGFLPTAYFTLSTRTSSPEAIAAIENILYGTDEEDPRLPTIQEIAGVYEAIRDQLIVVDHMDDPHTFHVTGGDTVVEMTGTGTWRVTSIYAEETGPGTFSLTSSD